MEKWWKVKLRCLDVPGPSAGQWDIPGRWTDALLGESLRAFQWFQKMGGANWETNLTIVHVNSCFWLEIRKLKSCYRGSFKSPNATRGNFRSHDAFTDIDWQVLLHSGGVKQLGSLLKQNREKTGSPCWNYSPSLTCTGTWCLTSSGRKHRSAEWKVRRSGAAVSRFIRPFSVRKVPVFVFVKNLSIHL